jgi:sulfur carrier protein ThiS
VAAALVATLMEADTAVAPVGRGGSAVEAPRTGKDHWHAAYQIFICGVRQPNVPTWEGSGVHTHGDGIIHIHPFTPEEEGRGARLVKWFEYGGGELTGDQMRVPGGNKTYKNGDLCSDGRPGKVQVSVNGQPLDDWSEYIPQDGDRITIIFGPEGRAPLTPVAPPADGGAGASRIPGRTLLTSPVALVY